MFAYVLIGLELIILYAAFWFVFVREPKPFELKENLWGYYSDEEGESLRKLLQEQGAPLPVRRTPRCRQSQAAQRLYVEEREGSGWVYTGKKSSAKKSSVVASVLGALGQELTRLSTKLT